MDERVTGGIAGVVGFREVAGALQRGRDGRYERIGNDLPDVLVAAEDEELVLLDCAAQGASEGVDVGRLPAHAVAVVVERVGVEMGVLEEFKSGAVPLISAALGDDIDDSAGGPTVLRIVVGGLDAELFGGIDRGNVGDRGSAGQVRDAVDQNFIGGRPRAVHGDTGRTGDIEGPETGDRAGDRDAGGGPGEGENVSALQRRGFDAEGVDGEAAVGRFHFDDAGVRLDGEALGDFADCELHIESGAFGDLQEQSLLDTALKALFFGGEDVFAGVQEQDLVAAFLIGCGGRDQAGGDGPQADGSAGYGGAGRVYNMAGD